MRTYQLVTLIGCTPSALEDEPAYTLDMLLAIDDAIKRGERNAQQRANRDNARGFTA